MNEAIIVLDMTEDSTMAKSRIATAADLMK